jgi:hypothetical protein
VNVSNIRSERFFSSIRILCWNGQAKGAKTSLCATLRRRESGATMYRFQGAMDTPAGR